MTILIFNDHFSFQALVPPENQKGSQSQLALFGIKKLQHYFGEIANSCRLLFDGCTKEREYMQRSTIGLEFSKIFDNFWILHLRCGWSSVCHVLIILSISVHIVSFIAEQLLLYRHKLFLAVCSIDRQTSHNRNGKPRRCTRILFSHRSCFVTF